MGGSEEFWWEWSYREFIINVIFNVVDLVVFPKVKKFLISFLMFLNN